LVCVSWIQLVVRTKVRFWRETDPSLAPRPALEFNLLTQAQRIIHLYAEIADRGFDLGVTKQQLNSSQIPGLSIDLRNLGATERMRPERSITASS
jgi:hypothetical protein